MFYKTLWYNGWLPYWKLVATLLGKNNWIGGWRHIWRTAVKSQLQVYCLSGIIETSTGSKFKIEPAVVLDFIFLAWETKFLHQILYLGM